MDDAVRWVPGPNGERAIAGTTEVNEAECIVILLMLGLWDDMPLWERQAFLERGVVYDTPTGQRLAAAVQAAHAACPGAGIIKTEQ